MRSHPETPNDRKTNSAELQLPFGCLCGGCEVEAQSHSSEKRPSREMLKFRSHKSAPHSPIWRKPVALDPCLLPQSPNRFRF